MASPTQGPLIILAPSFGPQERVRVRAATPDQLYSALSAWVSHKARYGRGRSEGAAHAKQFADKEIRKIKRELTRRHMPHDRLRWEERQ